MSTLFLLNHRAITREIILGYTKIGELGPKGLKTSTLAATRSKLVRRWIGFNELVVATSRISKPKRSSLERDFYLTWNVKGFEMPEPRRRFV